MRAAAFVAGAIIAVGIYLSIAAAFAFSPTWVGIGMLGIAVAGAVGIMVSQRSTTRRVSGG